MFLFLYSNSLIMDSRLQDYLKICDINEDPGEFIRERIDFVDKIVKSDEFQMKLQRYSALANKNRLLIYQLIQEGDFCNCSLAKILGLSEGSITHHVKKLDEAGLIIGRNKGHFIFYSTTEDLKKKL